MPYSQVQEEYPPTAYDNDRIIPPSPSAADTCGLPSVILPPVPVSLPSASAAPPVAAAAAPAPLFPVGATESDYPMAPRREIKYSGLEAAAAARKQRESKDQMLVTQSSLDIARIHVRC